ncbi:MAG: OmpA family protein [Gammaproteobacteria bacterium]|nr:OmpA family protein [Gammaproteobacteria bacterium]
MSFTKLPKLLLIGGVILSLAACASHNKITNAGATTAQVQASVLKEQLAFKTNTHSSAQQLVTIRTFYFKNNSAKLLGVNSQAAEANGAFLSAHPKQIVILVGHTSIVGNAKYNMTLSKRRINTVIAALVGQGVSKQQIQVKKAKGEMRTSVAGPESHNLNRRVSLYYCKDATCTELKQSTAPKK